MMFALVIGIGHEGLYKDGILVAEGERISRKQIEDNGNRHRTPVYHVSQDWLKTIVGLPLKFDDIKPISMSQYPVTWCDNQHTGLVWGWIFWWSRHGEAWVAAAPTPRERKRRERTRHSVAEELDCELSIMAQAHYYRIMEKYR